MEDIVLGKEITAVEFEHGYYARSTPKYCIVWVGNKYYKISTTELQKIFNSKHFVFVYSKKWGCNRLELLTVKRK